MRSDSLLAVTRFGLGPQPGEMRRIGGDPRDFVTIQCENKDAALIDGGPTFSTADLGDTYKRLQAAMRKTRKALDRDRTEERRQAFEAKRKDRLKFWRTLYRDEIRARYLHGVKTDHPFVERLVIFWSNHFAINVTANNNVRYSGPLLEREAIRPHVLGRFRDLLGAVTTHPGMLNYLDNANSVGPNSARAKRMKRRRLDINENHARELLELHTLGVNGGYTQDDVIETAKIMTGWTGPIRPGPFKGIFNPNEHEPGDRTVLGVTYPDSGASQLEWLLDDLAAHPNTAHFVCGKFARHFVGEEASEALIGHLTDIFLDTGGDLAAVSTALVQADEAWGLEARKMVPPYDFVVSCGRLLRVRNVPGRLVQNMTNVLAQPVWRTPSPAGWPDDDDAFSGGDAFMERIDVASMLAGRFGKRNVVKLGEQAFGDAFQADVRQTMRRAESPEQALVLLLMSPDLHRR